MADITSHQTSAHAVEDKSPLDNINELDVAAIEQDKHMDGAGKFLAKMRARPDGAALVAPWTEAEERAVKRKADLIVMPLLFWSLS